MSTNDKTSGSPPSAIAKAADTARKVQAQSKRAFDKGVDISSRMSSRSLAWWGIAMAGILLLTTNLIVGDWFRNWRADLTEDGLFTISPSTRKVLSSIDEPVTMKVYYTKALGEQAPAYGQHFQRVRTLLERYRDMSGGKLRLSFINPQAFSDAEDRAVGSGLKGIRLNSEGDMAYFGLVATNTTDHVERIDFFAPERERFLEYDLTKLVNALSRPKKKVVGLITGLPLEGAPANPMTGGRPQPAWAILGQIREFFELKTLQQDAKEIPAEIDTLMLVQPNGLTPEAALAIDQFALKGGRILAFVDPVPEIGRVFARGQQVPPITEMGKLLDGWGIKLDRSKVAADIAQARRVQFGGRDGQQASVTEYVVWLQLDKRAIDANESVAAMVERVNSASMGALSVAEGSSLRLQPILQTTERGSIVDADKVSLSPDPLGLLRGYQPGGQRLVLAARFNGDVKTAFPNGIEPPKPEAKDGEKKDEAAKPDVSKATEKKDGENKDGEQKAAEAKPQPTGTPPPLVNGKLNAIVIADSDLLHDQFWLDERDFLGQRIQIPLAHNAVLVMNALENLTGGEALRDLRGRGVKQRPFTVVDEIKRDAEKQFREKEQQLQARLKQTQEKLEGIQQKGEGGNVILTDKDRETIEKFKADMLATRRELRDVKLALNQDIDRLGTTLKFINIAAVPLLIGLGAIGLAIFRRRSDRAARGEVART
jgi:ABC-type uncharacterized transport system involved in gliding motility auxiliary subunit